MKSSEEGKRVERGPRAGHLIRIGVREEQRLRHRKWSAVFITRKRRENGKRSEVDERCSLAADRFWHCATANMIHFFTTGTSANWYSLAFTCTSDMSTTRLSAPQRSKLMAPLA